MNTSIDQPSKGFRVLSTVGGVVVALVAISCLQLLPGLLKNHPFFTHSPDKKAIAQKDAESMQLPGSPVSPLSEAAKTSDVAPVAGNLTEQELAIAGTAWSYFQKNWNNSTGLVNSTDGYAVGTMADQASLLAALVGAKELGLIGETEFDAKIRQTLRSLAKIRLYQGELPNKLYNVKTGIPVGYNQIDKKQEIGWSAVDIGRLALWLKIVESKYPLFLASTRKVWERWHVDRLIKNGQLYSISEVSGKENHYQDGRLGYENYAAYGLKLWGLKVDKALDYQSHTAFVNLYGQGVPYDKRDSNNYVESEPYILAGIETGWKALPKAYADRIFAAQFKRYQATNQLTAVTGDSVDRKPYFVRNALFVNARPWQTFPPSDNKSEDLKFLSAKAAIGWYVLYPNEYTNNLQKFVQANLKAPNGWYNGYYESFQQPNKSISAANNGLILEALLYKKKGEPLTRWAGLNISN